MSKKSWWESINNLLSVFAVLKQIYHIVPSDDFAVGPAFVC